MEVLAHLDGYFVNRVFVAWFIVFLSITDTLSSYSETNLMHWHFFMQDSPTVVPEIPTVINFYSYGEIVAT